MQSTCFICTNWKRKQTLEQQTLLLVTAIISAAIFYFCYHWNNNYCYSCYHTDMMTWLLIKFQLLIFCVFLLIHLCSLLPPSTSAHLLNPSAPLLPPPQNKKNIKNKEKIYLRDHNGNEPTLLFFFYPDHCTSYIFLLYFLLYITVQFFDRRFIWKSYLNFSWERKIFNYLLIYLLTHSLTYLLT